jgi:hypothetical protein
MPIEVGDGAIHIDEEQHQGFAAAAIQNIRRAGCAVLADRSLAGPDLRIQASVTDEGE